jgi:hypothetical protein
LFLGLRAAASCSFGDVVLAAADREVEATVAADTLKRGLEWMRGPTGADSSFSMAGAEVEARWEGTAERKSM